MSTSSLGTFSGEDPVWPWLILHAPRAADFLRIACWMDSTNNPPCNLVYEAMRKSLICGPRDQEWWDVAEWRDTLHELRSLTVEQQRHLEAMLNEASPN